MKTGTYISGAAHVTLIGFALFGGIFTDDPLPPPDVANVSVISAEDFAALTRPGEAPAPSNPTAVDPEPDAPPPTSEAAAPEQPMAAPEAPDETTAPALPDPAPEPEVARPAPAANPEPRDPDPLPAVPEAPPAAQMSETPPSEPAPPLAETPPAAPAATPRPARRVARDTAPPPPPEAEEAPVVTETTTPEPTPDPPEDVAEETPAAPEESAPEIVTEAETPDETPEDVPASPPAPAEATDIETADAPTATTRPRRAPERPARIAEAAPPAAPATPGSSVEARSDSVAAALEEALGDPGPTNAPAAAPDPGQPAGPPMTAGEKDALRVAVQQCWNVGALSSDALRITVVVAVDMLRDGKPDNGSIRMVEATGGTSDAARQAFEAARRAIIRCGATGFPLPPEKYAEWQQIEMTFNPDGMRLR